MLHTTNRIYKVLSKVGSMALGVALAFTACTNEQGEAHRVVGTGDEGENYEINEGHDSTVSGNAVTSALKADTAADQEGLVENEVAEKMDTSESYSSINGRSSTSNKGASVSVSPDRAPSRLKNPTQVNQTPTQGSNVTTTNKELPVKTTNPGQGNRAPQTNEAGEMNPEGQGGANRVDRPQTGLEDPNGRPIQNGQVQPANESQNKSNMSSDKTRSKKN